MICIGVCFQSVLFLFRRMMIKFFRFRQMRQKQQQKTPPSQRLIEFENRNCRFNAKMCMRIEQKVTPVKSEL